MNNDIYLIGEIGFEVTLKTVVDLVEKSDKDEPLTVHIHSGGGGVYDGLAIYKYLKGLKQEVHTKSSGLVASISSIIFLAGIKETRTVNETDSFLIHLPSGFAGGNVEDLEKTTKELKKIEDQLSTIYASETDITKEEAMELMKKDEMMDIDFLKEKGFVSEIIKFKAVANFNNINKNNMENNAVTKKEVEGIFDKFFNKFFPKKEQPTNKIVQDANGVELDFTELADEDTVSVGDKAMVDDSDASGDYVMPSGDTYTFEAGELTAITPSDEEAEEEEEETVDTLKKQIEDLKEELSTSAQAVVDKDTEVTNLTSKVTNMKSEVTDMKNQLTGDFDYIKKKKGKKDEDIVENKSRSLFKTA